MQINSKLNVHYPCYKVKSYPPKLKHYLHLPFILYLPESQVLATFCFWIFTIKRFCLSPVNQLLHQVLLPVSFLDIILPFIYMSLFLLFHHLLLPLHWHQPHLSLLKEKKGTLQKRYFFCLILLRIKPKLCQVLYRC